ncbi:MAG: DUF4136 domain-containing protein [Psychroflexus maritimus]
MKLTSLFMLVVLLASCKSSKSFVDYDESIDFTKYSTFNFYNPNSGLTPEEDEVVLDAIEENLTEKGLSSTLIAKSSINFYVEYYQQLSSTSMGVSLGVYGGAIGGAIGTKTPQGNHPVIALTIEVADALTNELIWQGVVERKMKTSFNDEQMHQFLAETVSMTLKNYPPTRNSSEEKTSVKN